MDVNLVRFSKDGSQKSISLPSSVTIIGRRGDCDLCIPLMSVSRRHCQLNLNDEGLQIRDLGSRNGTFLNGKQIKQAEVQAGDFIKIGPISFAIQIDGKPENISMPLTDVDEHKSSREKLKAAGDNLDRLEDISEGASDEQLPGLDEIENIDADSSTKMDELDSVD